jgi:hypothetical protein
VRPSRPLDRPVDRPVDPSNRELDADRTPTRPARQATPPASVRPAVDRTPVGRPFTRPVAAEPPSRGGSDASPSSALLAGGGIDPLEAKKIRMRNRANPDFEYPASLAGETFGKTPKTNSIVGSKLSGVDLAPSDTVIVNDASGNTTIINNNTTNYVTNVTYANDSWCHPDYVYSSSWCKPLCGPKACWDGWYSDGFSIGIGFGSGGFSFGLFYSDWGSPLCSSWNDPWWDGWCSQVVVHCPPRYRWAKPCWSPCGPWYTNYIVYRDVPATWCTPVYAWTPTVAVPSVTTVNNYYYDTGAPTTVVSSTTTFTQPVTTLPTALPPSSPAEAEAWDLLSNGFARSSADSFAQLHDAAPANTRALVGYAISLAMLDDMAGASSVMRQALATDPGVVSALPLGQQLLDRVRLLEQSAEVASRQAAMSRDALVLLGVWRSMQGRFTEAHLAVLSAQQAGEQSLGAARLRSWLEGRMIPPA